jgi:MFS family permease
MFFSRRNLKTYLALKGINRVIKTLVFSDVLIMGSIGLVAPIFAVFITENIQGGTIEVVGIAATIYLLVKSVGQLIAAEIIDRIKGERDDFMAMFYGSMFISLIYLAYIFVRTPMQLYLIQFVLGMAAAFAFPSWLAIFTRHIDKNFEGREWGIYHTLIDLVSAATAGIGGAIAYNFGFKYLFALIAIFGFMGSGLLWLIKDSMRVKPRA